VDEIRYARSDGVHLAYQVSGEGPMDMVLVSGFISHVEYRWHEPSLARFLRQLGSFTRLIGFDKRGMGLSDREPSDTTPTMPERIQDVAAVMDAAGSPRAVVCAWSEGGATAIRFAITHPERVAALILMGTSPRFSEAPDFPEGIPRDLLELSIEVWQQDWGTGVALSLYGPSVIDDERFMTWWAAFQRYAASPGAVANSLRMHLDVDVRADLPQLHTPTLVLHRIDDMVVPVTCARYFADHIPNACYHELPGSDHMYWLGDQRETLEAIRTFLADAVDGAAPAAIKRRRRPSSGWESLTPTELDVVRAVGTGLTNRQIAAQLWVSPRTIQTHIGNAFVKLGATSRAEIAAEVARRLPTP
jgi:pimeloyl-ACP methyl ester carboxylesterase/DNA-binding CsgD family transcriptional regulator